METVDELLQLDLIRQDGRAAQRFRFRHPLVRRAVYETTPGGWRLGVTSGALRRSLREERP